MRTRLIRPSTDRTAGTIEKARQQFTTNANVTDELIVVKDKIVAIFQSKASNEKFALKTDLVVKLQTSMCKITCLRKYLSK